MKSENGGSLAIYTVGLVTGGLAANAMTVAIWTGHPWSGLALISFLALLGSLVINVLERRNRA